MLGRRRYDSYTALLFDSTERRTDLFVLQKKEEARLAEERKQLKWQKEHMYDDVHTEDQMRSNADGYDSDDFM